jgi:hypothetical protein
LGQKLESAVNGDVADFRVGLSHLGINLCKTLVAGRVQEDVENLFPLFGRLQPFFRYPGLKEVGFDKPPSF